MSKNTRRLDYNVIMPSNEQEYYPMLDYEGKNELQVIESVFDADKKSGKNITIIYLMSPPGLGKTVMGGWIARKYDCPYQIINCVSTMTDMDLLGNYVLIEKETVWQDGPLPSIVRATNEGDGRGDHKLGVLIVNEINALTLNAQVALNPLMDKQQCVVLSLNNNEVVRVESDAHLLILASMNPDIMGVNELQESVRDRANIVMHMDYPSPEKEASLVNKITGIDESVARKFSEIVSECRSLKTRDHKIMHAPSTRGLLDWINYSRSIGVSCAYELCIVSKYGTNEEERNSIRLVARGKTMPSLQPMSKPKTDTTEVSVKHPQSIPYLSDARGKPITTLDNKTRLNTRRFLTMISGWKFNSHVRDDKINAFVGLLQLDLPKQDFKYDRIKMSSRILAIRRAVKQKFGEV